MSILRNKSTSLVENFLDTGPHEDSVYLKVWSYRQRLNLHLLHIIRLMGPFNDVPTSWATKIQNFAETYF